VSLYETEKAAMFLPFFFARAEERPCEDIPRRQKSISQKESSHHKQFVDNLIIDFPSLEQF
jgi:hypothetical protein